jgi:hypothetical protein
MDTNINRLKKLLDEIKTAGFWQRLFGWAAITRQMADAATDLQKLVSDNEHLREQTILLTSDRMSMEKDLKLASEITIRKDYETEKLNIAIKEAAQRILALEREAAAKDNALANNTDKISGLNLDNNLLAERNNSIAADNKRLAEENTTLKATETNLSEKTSQLAFALERAKVKIEFMQITLDELNRKNTELQSVEDERRKKYENEAATLTTIRMQIIDERNKEVDDRNALEIARLRKMKETWGLHQDVVKGRIKSLCNKHGIEYVDKVPFKGEPDNTIKICNELIVFDAKSPGSDDMNNFPAYLKDQADKARKYARQEHVKVDIFFVVPSNTLEHLNVFVHNLGDHNVYVISADSLEQIILCLKKIEEYEFAEQLSPEERDNICRILGKFAHLTKRRIQIDSFFAKQFIELAYKCESDLPTDVLDKVIEFEKSEKLNPPMEKRAKSINTKELEQDTIRLQSEAMSKGIFIDEAKMSDGLNDLQLYTDVSS